MSVYYIIHFIYYYAHAHINLRPYCIINTSLYCTYTYYSISFPIRVVKIKNIILYTRVNFFVYHTLCFCVTDDNKRSLGELSLAVTGDKR